MNRREFFAIPLLAGLIPGITLAEEPELSPYERARRFRSDAPSIITVRPRDLGQESFPITEDGDNPRPILQIMRLRHLIAARTRIWRVDHMICGAGFFTMLSHTLRHRYSYHMDDPGLVPIFQIVSEFPNMDAVLFLDKPDIPDDKILVSMEHLRMVIA